MIKWTARIVLIIVVLALIVLAVKAKTQQTQQTTYELVYIEWTDIVATSTEWHDEEELDLWIATEPSIVKQVGFLFRETDAYVVLLDSYFPGDGNLGAATKIPKGCITKIELLKP